MPDKAQKKPYYYSKGLCNQTLQVYDKRKNRRAIWDLDPESNKWLARFPYEGMPDFNKRKNRYFSVWRFTEDGSLENLEWYENKFSLSTEDNSYQLASEVYTQNQCYKSWPPLYVYDDGILNRWIWTREGDFITQSPYKGMPDPNNRKKPLLSAWWGLKSHDWPAKSQEWLPEQGEETFTERDLASWKDIKSGKCPRNQRWDPKLKCYFWAERGEYQEELNAPIFGNIPKPQHNRKHRPSRNYLPDLNPSINNISPIDTHSTRRAPMHFFARPSCYRTEVITTHTIHHTTVNCYTGQICSSTTQQKYTKRY